ncbi:MAG: bifunctional serine/threonine-protein kinase/formylglycine-generating enzyme family protein, partial [Candidatus Cloacimonadaceae bacterium]|nr:protein kinase [Candidatus Cloacimonadota bacterium]
MELTAGTKLGIFTIVKQIGAGGMSEVYLVKDNLGRPFALKTMSRRLSFDPSFRQRFEQEAKIMATLNHPNIVQMHSYFEAEGRFCLAMEYVEGGSLKDLSRKIGPIPEKRALNILKQIAEALSYAHGKGIIHRDIKPSNILLDADDNVKVMDFGIARMAEGPGLTMTGTQMGTLVYMSPEQIRDSKHVDEKSDIYSLGVTLYEMLTGMPPYDEQNSSDFDIRVSIVQNELPDPRKIYPHIDEQSMRLLDGLTRKNKEERLSLSKLLAGMLPEKQILSQSPAATIEKEYNKKTANPARNKKLSLAKSMLLVVVLAILIVVAGVMFHKNKQKTGNTPEMILVEGGSFQMGSNDGYDDEKPIHEVTVSSFWIGKYQVTQKEWTEVMSSNPSEWKGENLPVENVSWHDAVEYCNERSILEGLTPCYSGSGSNITCNWGANGYRLPTEAEWEYAAR